MGRAPNPGGPQRVTAHVVPRAKPFPDSDEEEKTTIESQWEDEASTTVEEGDVAERIRSLGIARGSNNTSVTGTGALDEPTVDDQHAQSAITPVRDVARLQITQGNDAGHEIEIRPGKTYTIGRAIDNDVVLTDIAVSRKHFDLRFEDGAWVIVDRGSGNGTVVNGNLEDNPFMLANGDVIEIGNTVFRFDQPNAAVRPQRTMEIERDDEEMSTVAGKPMRGDVGLAQPLAPMRPQRAKTLPPPTPLRTGNPSPAPPLGYSQPAPQPASTMPMPQMASRPPLGVPVTAAPVAPTMLGDQHGALPPNNLVTTLQGQGMPQQRAMYTYPQVSEIPPHSVHAQMLLIQTQNRRSDGSTALVPPAPYDGMPSPPVRYSQPQLTKRTKLVLAGVGLAVFAAVLTIAITKSGSSSKTAARGKTDQTEKKTDSKTEAMTATALDRSAENAPDKPAQATVEADEGPTIEPIEAPEPKAVAKTEPEPEPEIEKPEPVKPEPEKPAARKAEPDPKPTPKVAKAAPTRTAPRRERREVRRAPEPEPPPKRVAAGIDADEAKSRAENLYRAKKFGEASSFLASAARKLDGADARELRRTADMYAKLGRAFAQGTAPATKSTTAFEALRQAQNYDRNVGSAFESEIKTELAQVAPKAALSYMAAKSYSQARNAVIVAQQFGSSESVRVVSVKLESVARELYNEGMRQLDDNPSAAREKFKQITTIVDSKSTWYQKAQKQLRGS